MWHRYVRHASKQRNTGWAKLNPPNLLQAVHQTLVAVPPPVLVFRTVPMRLDVRFDDDEATHAAFCAILLRAREPDTRRDRCILPPDRSSAVYAPAVRTTGRRVDNTVNRILVWLCDVIQSLPKRAPNRPAAAPANDCYLAPDEGVQARALPDTIRSSPHPISAPAGYQHSYSVFVAVAAPQHSARAI